MSAYAARAAAAYKHTQVESRSERELVVLLYDGLVRFLTEGRDAMTRRDLSAKRAAIERSLAIVTHLQNTLNMDQGGQIAVQLNALYTYVFGRIVDASRDGRVDALDEALTLIAPLREAWATIATTDAARNTA